MCLNSPDDFHLDIQSNNFLMTKVMQDQVVGCSLEISEHLGMSIDF